MLHQKSPRAIFGVIAILLAISSPLVILFVPMIQLSTFRYNPENLLMIPQMINFQLLTISSLLLIASFSILALKRTGATYILSGLFVFMAVLATYFSGLSYIQIHPDYVEIKKFHTVSKYPMNEMDTIVYEYGTLERGRYIFIVGDEKIEITESPMMTDEKRRKLNRIARENDIEFIERAFTGVER